MQGLTITTYATVIS